MTDQADEGMGRNLDAAAEVNGVLQEEPRAPAASPEPATTRTELEGETEVGSVFVSNYPPYSFWKPEHLPEFNAVLDSPPRPDVPVGLYIHIPFCRKRCKFCYFRVYTDKNSDQVLQYVDALDRELQLYQAYPAVAGRPLQFVYFGGGTPSHISVKHLKDLSARLKQSMHWNEAEEVTFECEPGTLSQPKVEAIREMGVTRLSLGVENFDDRILGLNGRAHLSKEIYRVLPWLRSAEFPQVNLDLIAGMLGETWETWRETVRKTIDFGPDTVTVYEMELPFNTRFSRQYFDGELEVALADWKAKREWHQYAYEQFAAAGYQVSSAYTMVKSDDARFLYRSSLWHGADMVAIGVSSFGHMSGIHVQNLPQWDDYLGAVEGGLLPVGRAFPTTPDERLTRELILQLKLGRIRPGYFNEKFGVDILERFREPLEELRQQGMLAIGDDAVTLTRDGLLRVDSLLPEFYAPEYQHARYT